MQEDYLWDKRGEDAEIERLENALRAFRYAEDAPPALPAKIFPFEAKAARRFFRLSFAVAACALFAFVSLGVWLKLSPAETQIANVLTETTAPQTEDKITNEIAPVKPNDSVTEFVKTPKQIVERSVIKIRKTALTVARPNKTNAPKTAAQKPGVKLTKEEKYAYDQLMLALSITSSELKKVKDKAESVEEKTNDSENGR